ncbi:replication-relaxation family protein [Streptomyces sp. LaBMicrA B280]|uniref:replication-relaxation family protein n=1 Tax=Streptomyces sp. LaBMicrA B280 TaxID=3391001 RepID=UPI003BA4EA99
MLRALGIFQRATADQLWRMLRPADRHDRITRDTLNALKGSGLVRVETRIESGRQLWVLTEKGHKEAKLLLPKTIRISALRKLEYDDEGRPVESDGYDEHAAAVTSTAAVLTGAGYGTPLSWQTEIAHRLPYGYTQYTDLTMRAPDAGVPAMLLEVDRVTEPVDDLVAKLRRYTDWFELLAPKADPNKEKAARRQGAAVHDFRLWSRIYPPTGREGYVPVAFVFAGKTAAQRESRMRRLEQAARVHFAGTPYRGERVTRRSTTTGRCPWSSPSWSGSPPTRPGPRERYGAGSGAMSGRRSPRPWTTPTATGCMRCSSGRPVGVRPSARPRTGRHSDRCARSVATSSPTTAGRRPRGPRGPASGTGCAGRARSRPPTARRLSASRAARRRKHRC